MDIVIDLSQIIEFFSQPSHIVLMRMMVLFGWIPVAIVFIYGAFLIFHFSRQTIYSNNQKYIFLALDIPRGNEQSPKSVENLFTYIAGTHKTYNLIEVYWEGIFQLSFSFEIVGIDGYTQFVVRTPEKLRNVVETAVYSQYPDAEITEINDYTEGIPTTYPDPEWDVWGAEFVYVKPDAYPIKTWQHFEHIAGRPETHFRDPLATLLDLYSSLLPGEQIWYQLLVKPTGFDWPERCDNEIKKILNEKTSSNSNVADKGIDMILGFLGGIADIFVPSEASEKKVEEKDEALKMLQLKPSDADKVKAISLKKTQIGFEAKIRVVYVAKKEVMNKAKAFSGVVGYMKQFTDLNLNNLKPDMSKTATTADYFFVDSIKNAKKGRIVRNYIGRSTTSGRKTRLMTIDELATLWHFPVEAVVKAPMIQKAPGRKVEPPMSLPTTDEARSHDQLFESGFDEMINEVNDDSSTGEGNRTENTPIKNVNDDDIFIDEDWNQENKKINTNKQEDDEGKAPGNLPFA